MKRKQSRSSQRNVKSLVFERLESRQLMATAILAGSPTDYSNNVAHVQTVTQNLTDDFAEDNDSISQSYNLGTLETFRVQFGLKMADGNDWFRFRQAGTGTGGDYVSIDFQNSQGDLDMEVYNGSGQLIGRSTSESNKEVVSLNGRASGDYFVRVYGYNGASNSNYSLTIDPGSGTTMSDDFAEDNDSISQSYNLGTLETFRVQFGLKMADGNDWFRFRQAGTGTGGDYVSIDFQNSQGDLDMEVYNGSGQLIGRSTSESNKEVVSLNGRASGDYFVRVYGYNGASNANYSLTIDPAAATTGSSSRVLYLNFEGANMSASDLRRWAGTDWPQSLAYLDANNNGTRVQQFLSGRSDRDQIIQNIMNLVQQDLSPYGITVRRHYGLAVENVRATTVFLGQHDIESIPHVASDVDYGNNNRTDIAFVLNEGTGMSAWQTSLGLADVVLHEAGHTFGLFHVNTNQSGVLYPESMGLRYSTSDQSLWYQDTSFLDRTFVEYQNHGDGRGAQNSHRTMLQNFGPSFYAHAGQLATFANLNGNYLITASSSADQIRVRQPVGGPAEISVNGQIHVIGRGMNSITIRTQGDTRDQLIVDGNISMSVVIDRSLAQSQGAGKVSSGEVLQWNGLASLSQSYSSLAHHLEGDHQDEITECECLIDSATTDEVIAFSLDGLSAELIAMQQTPNEGVVIARQPGRIVADRTDMSSMEFDRSLVRNLPGALDRDRQTSNDRLFARFTDWVPSDDIGEIIANQSRPTTIQDQLDSDFGPTVATWNTASLDEALMQIV